MKFKSDERSTIFTYELQNTMRMTVGFSIIYFEF